jgi:hypothetical protein
MEDKTITLSISKKINISLSKRSCNFNDNYNLENGFIDKDEEFASSEYDNNYKHCSNVIVCLFLETL